MGDHSSTIGAGLPGGPSSIEVLHPPGTFAPTPASLIAVEAIRRHREHLHGRGIDWGSGSGILSIAAALLESVDDVLGLELVPENVHVARINAARNGVGDKVSFFESDSFRPVSPEGRARLAELEGHTHFILANPPSSSPADDGFGFRRTVVQSAGRYLVTGGVLFLSVSSQYGMGRVAELPDLNPGLRYGGVLASTDWVPFDVRRPDLLQDLETYAGEEARGGRDYDFRHPRDPDRPMTATEALRHYRASAESPLSRWQSHLFAYEP